MCAVHSYHPFPADRLIPFAANALQCIVNGEENPKIAPSPWDFVTLLEEDRATAIGSMHKNLVKIAPSKISSWTDRHTDVLITILRHRALAGERGNKLDDCKIKSLFTNSRCYAAATSGHLLIAELHEMFQTFLCALLLNCDS